MEIGLLRAHPDWQQAERLSIANEKRSGLIRIVVRESWRLRSSLARLERNGALERDKALVRSALTEATGLARRAEKRIAKLEAEIAALRQPRLRTWRLEARYAPFDTDAETRLKK